MKVCHLFISPGHNYFGRPRGQADTHPLYEVAEVQCVAGQGLVGDRFFGFKENYKGQITFFSLEVFAGLCSALKLSGASPGAARRNVVVSEVDLNSLVGREFEIQGIKFRGTAECAPCHWMDHAFASGAEQLLQRCGGLRAQILSNGCLRIDHEQADALGVRRQTTMHPPAPAARSIGSVDRPAIPPGAVGAA